MDGDNQKQPPQSVPQQQMNSLPEQQFYTASPGTMPEQPPAPLVTWTASEYVAHAKTPLWYAAVIGAIVVLMVLLYILQRDYISMAGVLIIGVLFIMVAGRPPRVLTYQLDNKGITIGAKFYPFANLKSYGFVDEGAFTSIVLMPMQRFMPPLSVFYASEDQEKIVAVLSQHLPLNNKVHDALDSLLRHLKF